MTLLVQGTFPFLSIALSADPFKENEVHDDYEACLWVLLCTALQNFRHNNPNYDLRLFNEKDPSYVDEKGKEHLTGGSLKYLYLDEGDDVTFACQPLNTLLNDLRSYWLDYYHCRAGYTIPLGPTEFEEWHQALGEYPTELLAIFDTALARTDWLENDSVSTNLKHLRSQYAKVNIRETSESLDTNQPSQSDAGSLKLRRFNTFNVRSRPLSRLSLRRGKKRNASESSTNADTDGRERKKVRMGSVFAINKGKMTHDESCDPDDRVAKPCPSLKRRLQRFVSKAKSKVSGIFIGTHRLSAVL